MSGAKGLRNRRRKARVRQRQYVAQGGRCVWCSVRMNPIGAPGRWPSWRNPTVEHLICQAADPTAPRNLSDAWWALACDRCNHERNRLAHIIANGLAAHDCKRTRTHGGAS